MHNMIVQLSNDLMDADDYITEDIFYEGFVDAIADYVDKDIDYEEYKQAFLEFTKDLFYINDIGTYVKLNVQGEENYFKEKFNIFQTLSANITIDEFKNDTEQLMELKNAIDDIHGIYIYFNTSWMTLDTFIRTKLIKDRKYYIGGIIGYRF